MQSLGIICAGRVYCDLNFAGFSRMPQLGKEEFAEELSLHAGGGAFISAAYFAALGHRSVLCGQLPAPPFDAVVAQEAAVHNIEISACGSDATQAPQLTVAMSFAGDRSFLTHRPGKALPPDYQEKLLHLIDADNQENTAELDRKQRCLSHLHISELGSLLETPELLDWAKAQGLSISLDCGWDEEAFVHPCAAECIALVDVFLPNEMEYARLQELGIANVASLTVVKQGGEGSTAYSGDQVHSCTAQATPVVDTIGAGDAFNAGFLSAWLEKQPIEQCLRMGNTCGALAVGMKGGASTLGNIEHLRKR